MKKLLFTLILATICGISAFAYDFSAVCSSGQTLYYDITSTTEPYTVEVAPRYNSYPYYSTYPTGNLVIPEIVTYNDTIYSVTSIGNNAFYGSRELTSVTMPNSVVSIGEGAFADCGLTSVSIPNSVVSIGGGAFSSSSLIEIIIPESVTSIGSNPFGGCYDFSVFYLGDVSQWCAIEFETPVGSNCSVGNSYLYINGSIVIDLVIPETVSEIKQFAFAGFSSITTASIPSSVSRIGNSAFNYWDHGLTAVYYNGSIEQWCGIEFEAGSYISFDGEYPLGKAYSLYINNNIVSDLVIPQTVTEIKNGAFYGATSLTSVAIPNSVTNIGDHAFSNCSNLASVTIPNSVTSIGDYVFYLCDNLTSVTIPNSVTSIGERAFAGCRDLRTIEIPNSVTDIDFCAFYQCTSLASVVVPESLTRLGGGAFLECENLHDVTYNPVNCTVDINGHDAGSRYIPFMFCSNIRRITIGENVSGIWGNMFADYDFNNSILNLTSLTCYAMQPPEMGELHAWSVAYDIPVYVPCGTKYAYQSAYGWSNFSNIQVQSGDEFPYETDVDVADFCENWGTVEIQHLPDCDDNRLIFEATANEGYIFLRWSDGGDAENHREISVNQDTAIYAVFGILNEINVISCSSYNLAGFPYGHTGTYYGYFTSSEGVDSVVQLNFTREEPLETTIRVVATNTHNKNVVTWNPVSNNTMLGYLMYRQDAYGQYEVVDTVAIDAECLWTDEVSNTAVRPYRYAVATYDSCGNVSAMSDSHRTIHLQISLGQGNSRNLLWTDYEGIEFSTYRVYRGTSIDDMEMIMEMSRENHTYTDFNTEQDYYYQIEIVQGRSVIISRSNIVSSNPNAIETEQMSAEIALFPNPVTDILNITSSEPISEIEIVNVMGQVVRRVEVNSDNAVCNVEDLKSGVYVVRIRTASATPSQQRFVKE